jgi:hypothetical protein
MEQTFVLARNASRFTGSSDEKLQRNEKLCVFLDGNRRAAGAFDASEEHARDQ